MTDLPPEINLAEGRPVDLSSSAADAEDTVEDQTGDEKLSSELNLPLLETASVPLTTAVHSNSASTVFYYPAPDMTMHPLLHTLAMPMPYPHSYPNHPLQPPQYLQPLQLSPTQQQQHGPHTPSSGSPGRPHHRKSNSLTQSHHGPVDPSTLRVPRVYVGNLAFSVGWQDLKDFFRNALGSVGRVDLIAHPSGRSKGCAVVEFDSIEEAGRAINELNNAEIHGRKIFIREDREGKGFGAQSAQRAAAAAQANVAAADVGAPGGAGATVGGLYGGMGGMMSVGGDVYGGMYGAGPGEYGMNSMQLYMQYLQQLQQHQIRQQHQQQQQMEPFLPQLSIGGPQAQPQPPPPLPLPLQGMPAGFASPLPLPFNPSPPFLSHPGMAPYLPSRQFIYPPLSPTSNSTPSTSPPPLMSPSTGSPPHTVQVNEPHSPRLLLSNLPFSFTRPQLYELASQYSAAPLSCDILLDGGTGRSRGVGVAVYSSREECERVAEEMRGLVVGERKIHVRRDE